MAAAIASSPTFTDDRDLDLAFPAEFIPAEVRAALPVDLHVCRYQRSFALGPVV